MKLFSINMGTVESPEPYDPSLEYSQEDIDAVGMPLDQFFIMADTSPGEEYLEVTSVLNWVMYYGLLKVNYLYMRSQVWPLIFAEVGQDFSGWPGSFDGITQLAICSNFFGPYALRVPNYVTDQEDAANWDVLLAKTKAARSEIVEAGRKAIAEEIRVETMLEADGIQFFKDVSQMLESFITADDRDFQKWLQNQAPYTLTGFASKSYHTQAREDKLVDIFVNYVI